MLALIQLIPLQFSPVLFPRESVRMKIKMLNIFLLLISSATLVVSNAGYADPVVPNMLERASKNGDGFAYAFSGGWPDHVYPDSTFLGGAMPVGEFLANLKKQQEHFESGGAFSFSFSSSSGTAMSQAQSSITFGGGKKGNILNWASDAMAGARPIPSLVSRNLGRDSEGAYAGAAIGPSGVYQSAQIYPENPNSPNIESRFASGSPSADGNFFAVATSSQSGSQTVDGKTTGFRKATTTVNDNGKVTTYTAQNP